MVRQVQAGEQGGQAEVTGIAGLVPRGDLIEKKSSGINLTARGEQALKLARRILAINDELMGIVADRKPVNGEPDWKVGNPARFT